MSVKLYDHQKDALGRMKNGCILCGGVGSGKSRTALAYYYILNGGKIDGDYTPMDDPPMDLYIITTARKRDQKEWDGDMNPFLLGCDDVYDHKVVVDSWNNIEKYIDVTNAFFIFDEQRVVGKGTWVKSFIKITRSNKWILLSATPGDNWNDYIPVFIANGFYKNRTEFNNRHVVWRAHTTFPMIERYVETKRLERLRNEILVEMPFEKPTESHHETINLPYNTVKYKEVMHERWNPYTNEPIVNAGELCYTLRRIVNETIQRVEAVEVIAEDKKKVIIFYNFDYELDLLKYYLENSKFDVAEWNGHSHEPIPNSDKWIYLVQYTAGCEGWNCIETDTIIFFSQNYSYKVMVQAAGRIDRLNTPFTDLYFYHLKTKSPIDLAIATALKNKQKFNESMFVNDERRQRNG